MSLAAFAGATSDNTASQYKLFMWDLRPFTKLTLSDTPSPTLLATHSGGGVQVKGVTSGATGLVYSGVYSSQVNEKYEIKDICKSKEIFNFNSVIRIDKKGNIIDRIGC